MRYVSVCSGIEAATVAWHPLGWRPALFAEIDKFPSRVLAHHYPEVSNVGDFTRITKEQCGSVDLLVGGTPCQDFSVAGLREGLGGERGNLTLEFLRLVDRLRPRWVVWENVPGVYSATSHTVTHRDPLRVDGDGERIWQDVYADEAHAFSCFLAGFQELGYGFAYRTLDAQYFGVPQRRRRVFLVGHSGDWRRAASVLFERHSMSGNPPPRRETRQNITGSLAARTQGGGGLGTDFECTGGVIPLSGGIFDDAIAPALSASGRGTSRAGDSRGQDALVAWGGNNTSGPIEISTALNACSTASGRMDFESETFITHTPVAIQERAICENPAAGPDGVGVRDDGIAYTLEARTVPQAVAFDWQSGGGVRLNISSEHTSALQSNQTPAIKTASAVRRLTPRERERLQGFPDDYTLIAPNTADGPRYKALGNSMAVPVMRWIGERIAMVDAL